MQEIVGKWKQRDPKWVRDQLRQIVASHPDELEAWYWIGVASHTTLADNAAAREAFAKILAAQPTTPSWLMPWTHLRMGMIAQAEGRTADASAALQKAMTFKEDGSGFLKIAEERLRELNQTGNQGGQ